MATNNAINGSVPLGVNNGGTGQTTLAANATLTGTGTAALTVNAVGTNGQFMIASTGSTPVFAFVATAAGSFIGVTGANSFDLDVRNYADTTWTPSLKFGGASVGMTYTTQSGKYVRIGQQVFFTGVMVLSAKGSSTGGATITGVPTNANSSCPVNVRFSNLTFTGQVFARIVTSSLDLTAATSGGLATALTDTAFGNTTAFYISGCYTTA